MTLKVVVSFYLCTRLVPRPKFSNCLQYDITYSGVWDVKVDRSCTVCWNVGPIKIESLRDVTLIARMCTLIARMCTPSKHTTKKGMDGHAGPALTLGRLGKCLGPPVKGAAKLLLLNYSYAYYLCYSAHTSKNQPG